MEEEGKVKLVAACDIRREAFETTVEINIQSDATAKSDFRCYTDLEEMLATLPLMTTAWPFSVAMYSAQVSSLHCGTV